MCTLYQFRFGGDEAEISAIFNEPELSKAFENAFMDNYAILLDRIRGYSNFILSKKVPDTDISSFQITLSEDEIISEFKEDLKRYLLHDAMSDVFASKLNVKENILERLSGSFTKTCIMSKELLYSFNGYIKPTDLSPVNVDYDTLEILQSEFLQNYN